MSRQNGFILTVPKELGRVEGVYDAKPERFTPIRSAAQALSRRGMAQAKVELCNAALLALVELLHELDADGVTPHVDDATGRILIPVPWGKRGYAAWKLRATEGRALNWILRERSGRQTNPLFVYDEAGRAWLLGYPYASKAAAMAYLRQCPITLSEWRPAWEAVRSEWSRRNLDGK